MWSFWPLVALASAILPLFGPSTSSTYFVLGLNVSAEPNSPSYREQIQQSQNKLLNPVVLVIVLLIGTVYAVFLSITVLLWKSFKASRSSGQQYEDDNCLNTTATITVATGCKPGSGLSEGQVMLILATKRGQQFIYHLTPWADGLPVSHITDKNVYYPTHSLKRKSHQMFKTGQTDTFNINLQVPVEDLHCLEISIAENLNQDRHSRWFLRFIEIKDDQALKIFPSYTTLECDDYNETSSLVLFPTKFSNAKKFTENFLYCYKDVSVWHAVWAKKHSKQYLQMILAVVSQFFLIAGFCFVNLSTIRLLIDRHHHSGVVDGDLIGHCLIANILFWICHCIIDAILRECLSCCQRTPTIHTEPPAIPLDKVEHGVWKTTLKDFGDVDDLGGGNIDETSDKMPFIDGSALQKLDKRSRSEFLPEVLKKYPQKGPGSNYKYEKEIPCSHGSSSGKSNPVSSQCYKDSDNLTNTKGKEYQGNWSSLDDDTDSDFDSLFVENDTGEEKYDDSTDVNSDKSTTDEELVQKQVVKEKETTEVKHAQPGIIKNVHLLTKKFISVWDQLRTSWLDGVQLNEKRTSDPPETELQKTDCELPKIDPEIETFSSDLVIKLLDLAKSSLMQGLKHREIKELERKVYHFLARKCTGESNHIDILTRKVTSDSQITEGDVTALHVTNSEPGFLSSSNSLQSAYIDGPAPLTPVSAVHSRMSQSIQNLAIDVGVSVIKDRSAEMLKINNARRKDILDGMTDKMAVNKVLRSPLINNAEDTEVIPLHRASSGGSASLIDSVTSCTVKKLSSVSLAQIIATTVNSVNSDDHSIQMQKAAKTAKDKDINLCSAQLITSTYKAAQEKLLQISQQQQVSPRDAADSKMVLGKLMEDGDGILQDMIAPTMVEYVSKLLESETDMIKNMEYELLSLAQASQYVDTIISNALLQTRVDYVSNADSLAKCLQSTCNDTSNNNNHSDVIGKETTEFILSRVIDKIKKILFCSTTKPQNSSISASHAVEHFKEMAISHFIVANVVDKATVNLGIMAQEYNLHQLQVEEKHLRELSDCFLAGGSEMEDHITIINLVAGELKKKSLEKACDMVAMEVTEILKLQNSDKKAIKQLEHKAKDEAESLVQNQVYSQHYNTTVEDMSVLEQSLLQGSSGNPTGSAYGSLSRNTLISSIEDSQIPKFLTDMSRIKEVLMLPSPTKNSQPSPESNSGRMSPYKQQRKVFIPSDLGFNKEEVVSSTPVKPKIKAKSPNKKHVHRNDDSSWNSMTVGPPSTSVNSRRTTFRNQNTNTLKSYQSTSKYFQEVDSSGEEEINQNNEHETSEYHKLLSLDRQLDRKVPRDNCCMNPWCQYITLAIFVKFSLLLLLMCIPLGASLSNTQGAWWLFLVFIAVVQNIIFFDVLRVVIVASYRGCFLQKLVI